MLPAEIEKRSFEIITEELGDRTYPEDIGLIVKRVIHTSADFDYADNLVFSENVVAKAVKAIEEGACIVTDTQMAKAGINKKSLAKWGGEVLCFIADDDVAMEAKKRGVTRSSISMEKAAKYQKESGKKLIFAIGNAPTALVSISELVEKGELKPELVIGVPVGFVNVVASKELIVDSDIPHIVARGRKGGSNVAAAICNGIIYQIKGAR